MSTPEQAPWYVDQLQALGDSLQQRAVEQLGSRLVLLEANDDGSVRFEASKGISVDAILEGGTASVTPRNEYGSYEYPNLFRNIRERLGLSEDPENNKSDLGVLTCNYASVEIFIRRERLSDAEAMFILALTLATKQRPVETVLREIRDCARLGIASELDDNLENPSPELTEREIFESTIYEVKHADDWDNQDDILDKLFESPTVRNFVKSFAEYKKHIASFATATDKEAFFRQLSFFEHKLPQLQAAADKALQLGKKRPNKSDSSNNKVHPVNPAEYCVVMAREVTNRQDEAYTRGFRYLPIHTLNGLSPAEKAKLKLVVLPRNYEQRLNAYRRGPFTASSDYDWVD